MGAAAVALALGPGPAVAAPAPQVVTGSGDWLSARGSDLRLGQARGADGLTRDTVGSLRPVWSAPVVTPPRTEVLVQGGAVYTTTVDGDVARLRTSDGSVVWSQDVGTAQITPALDRADGTRSRTCSGTTPTPPGLSTPAIDPGGVAWYAYTWLGVLPVAPTTQKPFTGHRHSSNGSTTPVVLGDRVLVAAASGGSPAR